MIYFDAADIAKCYLNEPGAERVREVAYGADGLASCELARLEFASILERHVRERHMTRREMTAVLKDFEEDEKNGVTRSTWPAPRNMAYGRSTRTTAHMLQAAKHFHVTGVNVLDSGPDRFEESRCHGRAHEQGECRRGRRFLWEMIV